MQVIESALEFSEVRSQQRALVFIWVDWAIQARQSHRIVLDLIMARELEANSIPAYFVDLSNGEGDVWDTIAQWLVLEGLSDSLLYSGAGPLLWLREGSIRAHVSHAAGYDNKRLLAICLEVFGLSID